MDMCKTKTGLYLSVSQSFTPTIDALMHILGKAYLKPISQHAGMPKRRADVIISGFGKWVGMLANGIGDHEQCGKIEALFGHPQQN